MDHTEILRGVDHQNAPEPPARRARLDTKSLDEALFKGAVSLDEVDSASFDRPRGSTPAATSVTTPVATPRAASTDGGAPAGGGETPAEPLAAAPVDEAAAVAEAAEAAAEAAANEAAEVKAAVQAEEAKGSLGETDEQRLLRITVHARDVLRRVKRQQRTPRDVHFLCAWARETNAFGGYPGYHGGIPEVELRALCQVRRRGWRSRREACRRRRCRQTTTRASSRPGAREMNMATRRHGDD